jgi:hypothetical protein
MGFSWSGEKVAGSRWATPVLFMYMSIGTFMSQPDLVSIKPCQSKSHMVWLGTRQPKA